MRSEVGATFGSHTSHQFCDEYSLLGTPRGARLTVPMRSPSPLLISLPRRTIRIVIVLLHSGEKCLTRCRGAGSGAEFGGPLQQNVCARHERELVR